MNAYQAKEESCGLNLAGTSHNVTGTNLGLNGVKLAGLKFAGRKLSGFDLLILADFKLDNFK